jgi:hypothetical protein
VIVVGVVVHEEQVVGGRQETGEQLASFWNVWWWSFD